MSQGKAITETGPVWALGAMSGTSLDGVDAAMVLTDGEAIYGFGETAFRPYSAEERAVLRAALGTWEGGGEAAEVVENAHAELLAGFPQAELIGFHGQTVAHEPRGRGTRQIGNGALLAEVLERPVVWDFRSADVALGGEGAPLAPFFHFAAAQYIAADRPLVFLNLGGVANVTWVDPRRDLPNDEGALLAFDTGPGNALLDDLLRDRLDRPFDAGGALAAKGRVAEGIVAAFMQHPFFLRLPPKSLDRDTFRTLFEAVAVHNNADAAATLTAATVAAVARGAEHFPEPPSRVLVSGGGRRNRVMMRMLADAFDCPVEQVEAAGLNGDMLEAQAFAHLAVRVVRGLPTSCPSTTGVAAAIGGGQVSRPRGSIR